MWPGGCGCNRPADLTIRLLPRHRNREAFLRRDQVVAIVFLQIDLDPVDLAAELIAAWAIVWRDRRAALLTDIAGFIAGEDHRYRHIDPTFAVLLAIHEERNGAALGQAA